MIYLAGVSTFLTVALALAALIHNQRQESRARKLLADRDPLQQQATAIRLPGYLDRLEREARQAGLGWTRRFFVLVWLTGAVSGGMMYGAGDLLFALVIPLLTTAVPLVVIRLRARSRAEAFSNQLAPALTLMANVIRAGGSLYHAVVAVGRQMSDPIRSEFAMVEKAMQLQVPAAEAMARARDRIGLPEFSSVVVACRVAGDAGADLDKVLEAIAKEVVDDRQFMKVMLGASAEGKASARMVTAVPLGILGIIGFLNPGYLQSSLNDSTVVGLYIAGFLMIVFGWVVIRKITDVRNW